MPIFKIYGKKQKYYMKPYEEFVGGEKVPSYDEKHYKEGIRREKKGDIYVYYYNKDNKEVKDNDELKRIKDLRIPTTWDYVWINCDHDYRIQVIGIDPHNKKQYIYTKKHKEEHSDKKYKVLEKVINLMDKIHSVLNKHQSLPKYDRNRVLSTMLVIILKTGIRAGKEFYAKKNNTYGLCSLRTKHISFRDDKKQIILKFVGKKNIEHKHKVALTDSQYQEMKDLMKLEFKDKIFKCKENDEIKKIDEFDLNDYIHEYIDPKITIKDFRTYLVNLVYIQCLIKFTNQENKTIKENGTGKMPVKNISNLAVKDTAQFIQHQPNICKSAYIYPLVTEFYINDYSYFIKNKDKETKDILIDIIKSRHKK